MLLNHFPPSLSYLSFEAFLREDSTSLCSIDCTPRYQCSISSPPQLHSSPLITESIHFLTHSAGKVCAPSTISSSSSSSSPFHTTPHPRLYIPTLHPASAVVIGRPSHLHHAWPLTTYLTGSGVSLPSIGCSYREVAMTPPPAPPEWSFRLLNVPHLSVSIPSAAPAQDEVSAPTRHTSISGLSIPTYPRLHLLSLPHEVRVKIWSVIYHEVLLGISKKWYQRPTTAW